MNRSAVRREHDHGDREHHGRGMRPLKALISLDEALTMCMDLAVPLGRKETVPLLESLRRVNAEDVRAPIDVPLADRAAMDGYAVLARETFRAGKFKPVVLRILETVFADGVPTKRVTKGRCTEVATGATLPPGADAVVMVEDTEREKDVVKVYRPVHPRENVSGQGEDIRKASLVVAKGEWLTPAKVGALAAIGRDRVSVFARPRVAILTTGDEVVPPGKPIRSGQVYDINSNTMSSIVRENGGEPVVLSRVADRLEALHDALATAVEQDLVVFSGGSSVGEKDMIIDVLRAMGDVLFHGVAVKPGKPTVLGRVEGKAVLGMPGYPTSCLSNCYMILAPMLRRMAHLPPAVERVVEAPLAKRLTSALGRVEFHTVRIVDGEAVPAYKESGAITSMAHADGYIEIPANVDLLEKGETVRVTLF
jgi:molybdopterin molybdotransferase